MERGKFLLLSASGVAAIVLPSVNACRESLEYPDSLSQPTSLLKITDVETIRSIGDDYRKKRSGDTNKQELIKLLSRSENIYSNTPASLEEQIKEDFEQSNTVIVDGWVLSKTEARQCALLSLE